MARYLEGANSRHVSDALMREIYLRDNGTCQKCFRAVGPRAAHFDHIIPWSQDGDTVPWNLQILCEPCNLAKGNRMDDQDWEKFWELDAITWVLHTLRYIFIECAPDLASLDDDQKAAVRSARCSVVRDLRDFADVIEGTADEADQELARRSGSARLRP
jgi:hypothetical protein